MQKCVNFRNRVRKTKNICVLCAWLGEKANSAALRARSQKPSGGLEPRSVAAGAPRWPAASGGCGGAGSEAVSGRRRWEVLASVRAGKARPGCTSPFLVSPRNRKGVRADGSRVMSDSG